MTTQERLRQFILSDVDWQGTPDELTADLPLIDGGWLDSMAIFQIVGYIEDEFGVEVGDEDLVLSNFGTIQDMAKLIERKQTA